MATMGCTGMQPSDWINLVGTLVATFLGAWFGYLFAGRQERNRDNQLHNSLLKSLLAEVEYCANLAGIYVDQKIMAPAYRLPSIVHDAAFSEMLATGELSAADVTAVISFYSQVRQLNWCMDELHRYRSREQSRENVEARDNEYRRAVAKAAEMRSPESRFYTPVVNALRRQG